MIKLCRTPILPFLVQIVSHSVAVRPHVVSNIMMCGTSIFFYFFLHEPFDPPSMHMYRQILFFLLFFLLLQSLCAPVQILIGFTGIPLCITREIPFGWVGSLAAARLTIQTTNRPTKNKIIQKNKKILFPRTTRSVSALTGHGK